MGTLAETLSLGTFNLTTSPARDLAHGTVVALVCDGG